MTRRGVAAAAGGMFVSAVLAGGWTGVVLTVTVVLVTIIAVCWVVADPDRPARLALLLAACQRRR